MPTHPDGTEWAHILVLSDGAVVHADTAREALTELIPGYGDLNSEEARLAARVRHALDLAAQAQRARIDEAVLRGRLDPHDPHDAALVQVLSARKDAGMLLASPDAPGRQAPWRGTVELVLVTTSYAPHTEVPPAQGRVVWFDPTGEQVFLTSLHAARAHDYWAAEPATPATGGR